MTSAVLLLMFGTFAGTVGASTLLRADWTSHAPRLAIAAWQGLATSVLLSMLAAGAALAISLHHVRHDVAGIFHLCAENLKYGYGSPAGTVTAIIGLLIIGALLARISWLGISSALHDHKARVAQVAVLDLVGQNDVLPGVLVLAHPMPYAFCIGGRRRRLVVTSALLETLPAEEVAAVLAHESAHLKQRHHTALLVCRTLFSTLAPVFPTFSKAMPIMRSCLEMAADDYARQQVSARSLHSALTTIARIPAPLAALAASATDVEARLTRLNDASNGMVRVQAVLTGVAIAGLVAMPLALAAAPAMALAWQGLCLLG